MILLCCLLFFRGSQAKEIGGFLSLRENVRVAFKGNAPNSEMIAGVLSTPENVKQRNRIREHLVIPMTFLIAVNYPSFELQEEMRAHKDIVLFRMEEKYLGPGSSPPIKVFGFFNIVLQHLPMVNHIVKMDDDIHTASDTFKLAKSLEGPFVIGRFHSLFSNITTVAPRRVARSGKHNIPQEWYKDELFPPYPSGALYMLSRDAVPIVLHRIREDANPHILSLPEDAILGLASTNVTRHHHAIWMRQVHSDGTPKKNCDFEAERCLRFLDNFKKATAETRASYKKNKS